MLRRPCRISISPEYDRSESAGCDSGWNYSSLRHPDIFLSPLIELFEPMPGRRNSTPRLLIDVHDGLLNDSAGSDRREASPSCPVCKPEWCRGRARRDTGNGTMGATSPIRPEYSRVSKGSFSRLPKAKLQPPSGLAHVIGLPYSTIRQESC